MRRKQRGANVRLQSSRYPWLRTVAGGRRRKWRQRLAFHSRPGLHSVTQRRRTMTIYFIQTFELGQFFIGFVLALQTRVGQEELIPYTRIFVIQLKGTFQQRQSLIVSLQLNQQPAEIVVRRKSVRIEL